jgi:hypothetical protein
VVEISPRDKKLILEIHQDIGKVMKDKNRMLEKNGTRLKMQKKNRK